MMEAAVAIPTAQDTSLQRGANVSYTGWADLSLLTCTSKAVVLLRQNNNDGTVMLYWSHYTLCTVTVTMTMVATVMVTVCRGSGKI